MSRKSFVDACLAGTARLSDVDDWIDAWHESDTDITLDAFLGFTHEEGALFAAHPGALGTIVAAHRSGQSVS